MVPNLQETLLTHRPHIHGFRLLIASLLAGLAVACPAQQPTNIATAPISDDSPDATLNMLRAAWHFARPLQAMAAARAASAVPANTLVYQASRTDLRPLGITLPNTDLVHAVAWLDLSTAPVILNMPALAGRYHSVAISSMTTDLLALLGTRTGSQGGRFALVSTSYTGPMPADTTPLRLACTACRLVARVLVKGPDDLETATVALKAITLEAESTPAALRPLPARPDAATWLALVNNVIAFEGEASAIGQKAAQFKGLSAPVELWAKALPALRQEFDEGLASAFDRINGWTYPGINIADAAADDLFRAQMAHAAPDALPRVEAMELQSREDGSGQPLDGSKAYRLRLPYNLPIGGFWSVTMYQLGKNGLPSLVSNPLNRFAVGDRSDHLRADRNGSTELFIQTGKPQGERIVNWLPAPQGRFGLVFRAYLPKSEMLDGSFRLPAVIAAEPIP